MHYEVHTVGDDDLPPGVHSVIVERPEGPALLLINGAIADCWRLMRTWEGTFESCEIPSITVPLTLVV